MKEHKGWVTCLKWKPGEDVVASAGDDKSIKLWSALDAGEKALRLKGHTRRVWGLDWSPNGQQLVSCGEDRTVRLWNVEKQELVPDP